MPQGQDFEPRLVGDDRDIGIEHGQEYDLFVDHFVMHKIVQHRMRDAVAFAAQEHRRAGHPHRRVDEQVGQKVFRIYGGDSGAFGQSWTPINPNTLGNARNLLGLPNGNSGQFLLEGRILDVEGISARTALPLDGNTGGAVEYLIPNAAKKVALDKVSNGDF